MQKTAIALMAAVTLLFAGACSSDDDGASTSTTAASEEGGSSALPPIEVDGAGDVTMKVGEFIRVNTEDADRAESSDTAVLTAEDAYSDGSAEFTAGAEAIGEGTAVLSVYSGDDLLYEVDVTVEG